jgi:F-type H+-transporting ATPase subunit c
MKTKLLLLAVTLLALANPILAQTPAGSSTGGNINWVAIASFAMAIASGLCGLAQSKAAAAACEGMGRNPGAAASIRFALILSLVLIESLALYTLIIVFKVS